VQPYDFDQSVGVWLTLATQAYHRAINDELAPHGITYRQTQVLGWLALDGEMTQADLAAKMFIEPPTLVGVLDRMERAGWIVRRCCDSDRRKKYIQITPAADPTWDKIVQCARRVRARATAGMSEHEMALLKRLLERLRQNVQTPTLTGTIV
jgi:MarR family transcriptional regulator for hemolysin